MWENDFKRKLCEKKGRFRIPGIGGDVGEVVVVVVVVVGGDKECEVYMSMSPKCMAS